MNDNAESKTPPEKDIPEQNGGSSCPVFHFGPQAMVAPEDDYFAAYASAPDKIRMPKGTRELGILLNNRRRAAVNKPVRGAATAWIDEDDSGTYDPKLIRRTPASPSKRAKRVRTSEVPLDKDGNPKPRKASRQIGFRYTLVVKLPFKSKKALNHLQTLPAGPYDTESDGDASDSDDSGHGVSLKRKRDVKRPTRLGATSVRSDGLTIDQLTDGHPQRRGCRSCFEQDDNECSLIEHEHDFPCEACEDAGIDCFLIIPPVLKKICERCKGKRRSCSYRLNGGRDVNSCKACEEEGVACCAGPLLDSSYAKRFTGALSAPAAPKPEDRERMYVSCNQCRSHGKRCSLKGKKDTGPCSNCRMTSQACKFVHPPTRAPPTIASSSKPKKKYVSNRALRSPSISPPSIDGQRMGVFHSPSTHTATLYSELEHKTLKAQQRFEKGKHISSKTHTQQHSYTLSPTHPLSAFAQPSARDKSKFQVTPKLIGRTLGIAHINITTAFCHPIQFNYVPDPLSRHPCSWCTNPFFGLYGLADASGPRVVEGFYPGDGLGFEEIFGGYSELRCERSKMCVACTFERVRILGCERHWLRKLSVRMGEVDSGVWDDARWDAAAKAMLDGDEAGSQLVKQAKWCSICPQLAVYKCVTQQDIDADGNSHPHSHPNDEITEGEGCGLLLCTDCASLMAKCMKGGVTCGPKLLEVMIQHVKTNEWRFPNGVRADASFLLSEGELVVRMGLGMGVSCSDTSSPLSSTPSRNGGVDVKGKCKAISPGQRIDRKGKGKSPTLIDSAWAQVSHHPSVDPNSSRKAGVSKTGVGRAHQGKAKEIIEIDSGRGSWGGGWAKREVEFGGLLQPKSEDVERVFGGQNPVVDLTGN